MAKASSRNTSSSSALPPLIFAHASVHSIGGQSLFESGRAVNIFNVRNYHSDQMLVASAVQKLQAAGFIIMGIDGITISIAAPAEVYQKAFRTTLRTEELPTIKERGLEDTATFILPSNEVIPGTIDVSRTFFSDVLEGVSINEPVYFMNSFIPPKQNYWHLSMPSDVSAGLNAERAHRNGITGRGIHVVMVDTGWYQHPYFTRRGYRSNAVVLGPGTSNPMQDDSGHGTGESANIFAVAPDATFTMVKMSHVDSAGAFNRAVALNPHIISCSWGISKQNGPLSGNDLVISAAIANAVSRGITVVFAAGNGHWGFPGQHPDVISAGGVYVNQTLTLSASDYASGFTSNIFPGRRVPDVCGLVGMKPSAAYLMLPVQPGVQLDTGMSGGAHPQQDQTAPNDGWAAFSGTSAAAPQIAGICALLKQARPTLTSLQIKKILLTTAWDVTIGTSNSATGGHSAAPGVDLATGYGLCNAYAAVLKALQNNI